MKRAFLIMLLTCATPAMAEENGSGLSLMERGVQMLMEGLLRELEPALEDMEGMAEEFGPAVRDFAAQMGPALRDLLEEVEDWSGYAPPEILDNGDIIIRRKPVPAPKPDSADQIEI
ncbi:hypothetical protein [Tateyamaria sp. SN6-1]|uniref:hypothetical protein n=1 Tax=Tateyamaria sp. SN6-1 TaxID=3092148 RepID=UPI0039F59CE0